MTAVAASQSGRQKQGESRSKEFPVGINPNTTVRGAEKEGAYKGQRKHLEASTSSLWCGIAGGALWRVADCWCHHLRELAVKHLEVT